MTTADHQPQESNIEQVRELLSAYLDGEVTSEEIAQVEEAVYRSPELRRDLETLRQTVSLLKRLPPMPAPRPFTLSEARTEPGSPLRRTFGLPSWLRGWAVVAATLACVMALGGVFVIQQFGGGMSSLAPAEIALQEQAEPAAESEMPAVEITQEGETLAEPDTEPPPAEEKMVAPELLVEEEALPQEAVEEAEQGMIATDEAAEDTASVAGEAAEAEDIQPQSEAVEESVAAGNEAESGDRVEATPTPVPTMAAMATTTPTIAAMAPAEIPAEESALAEPQAIEEEAAVGDVTENGEQASATPIPLPTMTAMPPAEIPAEEPASADQAEGAVPPPAAAEAPPEPSVEQRAATPQPTATFTPTAMATDVAAASTPADAPTEPRAEPAESKAEPVRSMVVTVILSLIGLALVVTTIIIIGWWLLKKRQG